MGALQLFNETWYSGIEGGVRKKETSKLDFMIINAALCFELYSS